MVRSIRFLCILSMILFLPLVAFSAPSSQEGETALFNEMKNSIPKDNIKNVDDLYKKWQEVQVGSSKAVIIDCRTESEFDSGHLLGSNNVSSAYMVAKIWPDTNTEIWIFCRTQHRATYYASLLMKYGYKNVYLVEKGVVGWAEKGYPLANKHLGEIKVAKYQKDLKETYQYRDNK